MVEGPLRSLSSVTCGNKLLQAVLQTLLAAFAGPEPPQAATQQDVLLLQEARLTELDPAHPSTTPPPPEVLSSCFLDVEDVATQAAILDGCVASEQGPRATMEDTYVLHNTIAPSEFSGVVRPPARSGIYAVFDGHCGAGASSFARDNLLQFLQESENFPHAAQDSLAEALSRMETSLAEVYRSKQQAAPEASPPPTAAPATDELGGTTALVAVLMGDVLHIANIGDCRAVLCRRNEDGQGEAIALSTDHTPEHDLARIKATGFEVSDNRIDGIIEVARTLGDFQLSHLKHMDGQASALSAEPELRCIQLLEEDEFLILASDGFWKMHSSNQAAIMEARRRLRKQLSPRAVADELVQDVLTRKGDDNVTVIVVQLARLPDLPRTTSSRLRLSAGSP